MARVSGRSGVVSLFSKNCNLSRQSPISKSDRHGRNKRGVASTHLIRRSYISSNVVLPDPTSTFDILRPLSSHTTSQPIVFHTCQNPSPAMLTFRTPSVNNRSPSPRPPPPNSIPHHQAAKPEKPSCTHHDLANKAPTRSARPVPSGQCTLRQAISLAEMYLRCFVAN